MTAKLIMSVKNVNGIATIVYICKERRRLYECKLAELIDEFKKAKRKDTVSRSASRR